MKEHQGLFSVERMSNVLGVSKQGYYKFLNKTPSKREIENTRLSSKMTKIHIENRKTYGHRRLYIELRQNNEKISKGRVIRLMKLNGISPKYKKPFRVTTKSDHGLGIAPNILNRDFVAKNPNEKWVSDISYIPTREGFLYLAVIIDLFSRMIVGFNLSSSMNSGLVLNAFRQALIHRGYPRGLLFHSDQGVQYACDDFKLILKKFNIKQSMSRKGNCFG